VRRGGAVTALLAAGVCCLLAGARLAAAGTFTAQGQFLYEDRIWNQNGYTGAVQNLPIRRADIEVVKSTGNLVIGTGSTDASGNYSIVVTGQTGTINVYVRCKSSTDNAANYHVKVVDTFVRTGGTVNLTGSVVWSITTNTVSFNTSMPLFSAGTFLTQDNVSGFGVAQAFNILDQGVDAFDYLASGGGIGRFPTPAEFIVYGWDGASSDSEGSNYFWQGVFLQSVSSGSADTDGWSDMVILHETGHWASDMFSNDHNPGGIHFIGDSNQDPRLSYGEGYATFFASEVREFRSTRLNGGGQPIDNHVSFYADLTVPPALPNAGGLGFAYDVETGLFNTGSPIGQIGSACETNVTSAMWDVVDGTTSKDESPGLDDDAQDDTGALTWPVLQSYLPPLNPPHWITVEDFYRGWFAVHGAGFQEAQMESAFAGLGKMPFREDALEPNDDIAHASIATPSTYSVSGGGGVVLNEFDLGAEDKCELQNAGTTAVDLTSWTVTGYWTGGSIAYTIPSFSLPPGANVVIHEGGSAAQNSAGHLYIGSNLSWANNANGAATLANNLGAAEDFVRWGGDTTPIPSGTTFTGSLASAPAGKTISRNASALDTNAAGDFSNQDATFGWPNFTGVVERTIAPEGNPDVYRLNLSAGSLIVVHVDAPHSAGEPRIELLDGTGAVLGSHEALYGLPSQAELQFYTSSSLTAYVRLTHAGAYTDFAAFKPVFFLRPVQTALSPPVAVTATPANASDVNDAVHMTWLNGGAYDQTRVYLDGGLEATLSGTATSYDGSASRGSHIFSVQGVIGGNVTTLTDAQTFTGILDCTNSEGLETGVDDVFLEGTWDRTSTLAKTGSFSLTDSPSGNYGDNTNTSAALVVPTELTAYPKLEFDHICITEDDFDFGIVEISIDFGTHWTELARYDMGDHPGWSDGSASAADWVHESIDLNPYVGKKVRIRFRLLTDPSVTQDGWYVDDVTVSDSRCRSVTAVGDEPKPIPLLAVRSNPFRRTLQFTLHGPAGALAEVDLYDVSGRRVRRIWAGNLPGDLDLAWEGRDTEGRPAASGVYFVRARVGRETRVVRILKLP
jgi:Immune inhibitor A-like, MAM domain/Lamin Tail Domain/FlgD Ig-like domain